jgi:hypothetical protein
MLVTRTSSGFVHAFQVQATTLKPWVFAQGRKVGR